MFAYNRQNFWVAREWHPQEKYRHCERSLRGRRQRTLAQIAATSVASTFKKNDAASVLTRSNTSAGCVDLVLLFFLIWFFCEIFRWNEPGSESISGPFLFVLDPLGSGP